MTPGGRNLVAASRAFVDSTISSGLSRFIDGPEHGVATVRNIGRSVIERHWLFSCG